MRTAALFSIALLLSCGREPALPSFQPTLPAADLAARQRYGGDIIVFVSDDSTACRRVRGELFRSKTVGDFIAKNFAAAEVPLGTPAARDVLARYQAPASRPQIIIASQRLNNLRIHVMRLDRIDERRFLGQLQAIKRAKTAEEFRRTMRR